jgi:hypothetical protein
MSNSGNVPASWFEYEYPLPNRSNSGPSGADYSSKNVAPLIEFFANILGKDPSELQMNYDDKSVGIEGSVISVRHPGDNSYLNNYVSKHNVKSPQQAQYEKAAKNSQRLKKYQDESPAGIEYFQD